MAVFAETAKYCCCIQIGDAEHIALTSECKMFSFLAKNMVDSSFDGTLSYKFKVTLDHDLSMDEVKMALEIVSKWAKTKPFSLDTHATTEPAKVLRTLEVLTYLGAPTELQQKFAHRFLSSERKEKK